MKRHTLYNGMSYVDDITAVMHVYPVSLSISRPSGLQSSDARMLLSRRKLSTSVVVLRCRLYKACEPNSTVFLLQEAFTSFPSRASELTVLLVEAA